MSRSPAVDPGADDERGVPIATVSAVLGVPMPTLRSWELRYGIPDLARGSGQHRRYLPAEVHALRLMRDEVARGLQAGAAAESVRATLGTEGPATTLVHHILAAAEELDSAGIRRRLDEAVETLGLASCIDDVLLPSLRQVGVWWAVGHCDVVQERMATESVRAWLDRRISFAPPPTHPRPILLSCGPSDLHTVGLESMAALLRYEGWACRVLGARTPTLTLLAATQAAQPAAVILVSHLATGRRRAVESLVEVHELCPVVFYAGNAFTTSRSRRGVPGTYLGGRLTDACTEVIAAASAREAVQR